MSTSTPCAGLPVAPAANELSPASAPPIGRHSQGGFGGALLSLRDSSGARARFATLSQNGKRRPDITVE